MEGLEMDRIDEIADLFDCISKEMREAEDKFTRRKQSLDAWRRWAARRISLLEKRLQEAINKC